MPSSDAHLRIRIELTNGHVGPGKAALLRAIGETGSISAAARSLDMSYAKAWKLTEVMNVAFHERLVETFAGGNRRGGATLTPAGRRVLAIYDSIREEAERAVAKRLHAIGSMQA